MPKIVYLDNLPAQEGVSILENQNKIEVVKIESNNIEQSFNKEEFGGKQMSKNMMKWCKLNLKQI